MGDLRSKYGPVAMGFHWIIASLIITNFIIAWIMNGHALFWDWGEMKGPDRLPLVQWHKTIGISVLVLSVLRLVWRLIVPPPPFSAHLAPWERLLAHTVHGLFYVFMIAMPVAGWIMVSASIRYKVLPVQFFPTADPAAPFHFFDWPQFPGFAGMTKDQLKAPHEMWKTIHTDILPWMGYALILLHVAGALKHQFFDKDNELARMVPFLGTPGRKGIG